MITIEQLTAEQTAHAIDQLSTLLADAVDSGASIGFLPPLDAHTARAYWAEVIAAIAHEARVLLVARDEDQVVATVQLDLPQRANARHRAEIQKLMVHTAARGRGIARRLMTEIETCAQHAGRTTLVLDTRAGDVSERLYKKLGYITGGIIPKYAQSADGTLHTTVFFFKLLQVQG